IAPRVGRRDRYSRGVRISKPLFRGSGCRRASTAAPVYPRLASGPPGATHGSIAILPRRLPREVRSGTIERAPPAVPLWEGVTLYFGTRQPEWLSLVGLAKNSGRCSEK